MKCAYVRPHVRALPQMVLAIRALESLRYPTLVSIMSRHVTTMLVAAVTLWARVAIRHSLLVVVDDALLLQWPPQERIWKKKVGNWLVNEREPTYSSCSSSPSRTRRSPGWRNELREHLSRERALRSIILDDPSCNLAALSEESRNLYYRKINAKCRNHRNDD